MGLDQKKDIIKRGEILHNYINLDTMIDRIKRKLVFKYKDGEFYHIPIDLFDKSNERDKRLLEELKFCFLNSKKDKQLVPLNLFDLENPEEAKIFFDNLRRKDENGIKLFFDSSFNGIVPEEQVKYLEELRTRHIENRTIEFSTQSTDVIKKALHLKKSITPTTYIRKIVPTEPRRRNCVETISRRKSFAYFNRSLYMKLVELANETNNLDNNDKYRAMIYLNLLDAELVGHSKNEFVREIREMAEKIGNTTRKQHKRIENIDITGISDKSEEFEEHKQGLLKLIEVLSACGCLQSLIAKENKVITDINNFLSAENALDKVSEKDLIDRINDLNITKKDDVIDLIIFSRHFSNKLAHTFDDYMYTTLYFTAVSQDRFIEEKNRVTSGIEANLKALFNRDLSDSSNVQEIVDELLKYDLDYQKIRQQYEKLQNELSEETNPTKKQKISKKIDKKNSELDNKKTRYQRIFEGLENEKKRNPRRADEKINAKLAQINTAFIKKYENKEEYTKAVLNEFVNILDDYKKAIVEKKGLPFSECPSYFEFFNSVQWNAENPEFNDLNCERDDIVYNVADKMRWLLETCQKDGVFAGSRSSFMHLAKQYDFRECAYNIKHNDTMILISAMKDRDNSIYMEQTPCQDNKEGVTDIFRKKSVQIFGAHFKKDDPEAKHDLIQTFRRIPQEMDDLFSETGERISLNTNIPQKRLTQAQIEEFKSLAETIKYLENGDVDSGKEVSLPKLEELRELKNNRRTKKSYEAIKVRILLGSGLENYRKYFFEKENLHEMVSAFHDQKSNSYFEEQRIALKGVAKKSTYSDVENVKAQLNKSMEENDKTIQIP